MVSVWVWIMSLCIRIRFWWFYFVLNSLGARLFCFDLFFGGINYLGDYDLFDNLWRYFSLPSKIALKCHIKAENWVNQYLWKNSRRKHLGFPPPLSIIIFTYKIKIIRVWPSILLILLPVIVLILLWDGSVLNILTINTGKFVLKVRNIEWCCCLTRIF